PEIEAALGRVSGVGEAAVVLREDEHGEARLFAYVAAAASASAAHDELTPEALAAALRTTLPGYMVPSVFMRLPKLPRSSNGKIDRAALPAVSSGLHAPNVYVEPRTPLEHDLVALWQELLGVSPIGVRDNFFDRGGHSLLAVKLVDQIARATGR